MGGGGSGSPAVSNLDGVRPWLAPMHWFFRVPPLCCHRDPSQPERLCRVPARAETRVYAARAVSLPALYTEPTAAQLLPNFINRGGARPRAAPPGRRSEPGSVARSMSTLRRRVAYMPGAAMGRWERMVRLTRWYGDRWNVPSQQLSWQLARTRHLPLRIRPDAWIRCDWFRRPHFQSFGS